jgi:anti-sigma-K factor RskA
MTIKPENYHAIADEYVLGLLEPGEAAAVSMEAEGSPALATAIARSRERFLPLDTSVEPLSPSRGLWDAIAGRLPEATAATTSAAPDTARAAAKIAVNDNVPSGWRATALGAIAASLLLATSLGWSLMRTVEPLVIAVLVNEAGQVQAVVEDFGNETASVRLLEDVAVPADRMMQVWTLPSRETGPVSLGLLAAGRSAVLRPPALPQPRDSQLYEITLEQAGGSPTGRPTGPILAKGLAQRPR